ncbi:MAG: ferrochelatase, partial [Colwellia sp.]|nr:ferrochelatase [Colwellia sp.]
MKYEGRPNFSHKQHDKIGILITNLGTPEAPKKADLKIYLREFLSDP